MVFLFVMLVTRERNVAIWLRTGRYFYPCWLGKNGGWEYRKVNVMRVALNTTFCNRCHTVGVVLLKPNS
jgi:hypothetical protein